MGEMYIDVAKDSKKTFFVNTLDFQIKVCGIKYNVSAYHDNNSQSVVLIEGSVGVKMKSKNETCLLPNDMLIYRDNHLDKKSRCKAICELERWLYPIGSYTG
jgi:ferric-dicitrate binding protein FerR (iron transport regulator)